MCFLELLFLFPPYPRLPAIDGQMAILLSIVRTLDVSSRFQKGVDHLTANCTTSVVDVAQRLFFTISCPLSLSKLVQFL